MSKIDDFFGYAATIGYDAMLLVGGKPGPYYAENLVAAALYGNYAMAEATVTLGMFLMWAWVDEATWDGHTFEYAVQLDGGIKALTIAVDVET